MSELTPSSQAKLIKELGRGGQGIVYLVELEGQKMALKWYIDVTSDDIYKNLQEKIRNGSLSDAFLCSEYLTRKEKGSYGDIMKLRPQGDFEFGNFQFAKVRYKSFEAMVNAVMKICEGFMEQHLNGCSYQDLNDDNFFIHSEACVMLICDNDNVMSQDAESGILGKSTLYNSRGSSQGQKGHNDGLRFVLDIS